MKKAILLICIVVVGILVVKGTISFLGGIISLFSDPDPETTAKLWAFAIGTLSAIIFLRMYMTQSKYHAVPKGYGRKMTILATITIFAGCFLLSVQ